MRSYWTQKELKYLRDNWEHLDIKQIADHLGRSAKSVKSKAYREGIDGAVPKKWTNEDVAYLDEKWGVISIEGIAKNLNRTTEAVRYKAHRIGLGAFTMSVDGVSLNEFSNTVNIDGKRLLRWKKKHDFPVVRKRILFETRYFINIDEFWEWATDHKELINFSNIEPNILGAEPEWVSKRREADKNNHKKPIHWTKQEETKLIRLLREYKYTYDDLVKLIGRSERSIQMKLSQLGINERPIPRKRRDWTNKEINELKRLLAAGVNRKEIAKKLGRSPGTITNKIMYL